MHTNSDEVIKLYEDISIKKFSRIHNFSGKRLMDAFLAIPTDLFNRSFELAEIPNEWKVAKVSPLRNQVTRKMLVICNPYHCYLYLLH